MTRAARLSVSLFWTALLLQTVARAETVADFYRGKTIELAIAGAPAGGYDVAARTLANHYSRHIPGNPTVIVKNMPGAAGLVVTNYLYNVAKRDGTVIGMPTSNVPIEPRLKLLSPDGSNVKFDLANFSWIGTPLQEPQITWVWHTAPAASVDDLKTNTILMGATTASADNAILPMLVDQVIGTKMKVLTGYQGQNEINLAAERGEVQGNNTGLSNLTVNKADWLRDGKVRILLQFGNERLAQLPDVPTRDRTGFVRSRQSHAAVLRPQIHHGAAVAHSAASAGGAHRRVAGGVRSDNAGSRIYRGSSAHRPRYQLARRQGARRTRRRHRRDAAGGGRSPARATRPRRRQIVGAVMAATRRGWHSPAKTCCMMSNDFCLGG